MSAVQRAPEERAQRLGQRSSGGVGLAGCSCRDPAGCALARSSRRRSSSSRGGAAARPAARQRHNCNHVVAPRLQLGAGGPGPRSTARRASECRAGGAAVLGAADVGAAGGVGEGRAFHALCDRGKGFVRCGDAVAIEAELARAAPPERLPCGGQTRGSPARRGKNRTGCAPRRAAETQAARALAATPSAREGVRPAHPARPQHARDSDSAQGVHALRLRRPSLPPSPRAPCRIRPRSGTAPGPRRHPRQGASCAARSRDSSPRRAAAAAAISPRGRREPPRRAAPSAAPLPRPRQPRSRAPRRGRAVRSLPGRAGGRPAQHARAAAPQRRAAMKAGFLAAKAATQRLAIEEVDDDDSDCSSQPPGLATSDGGSDAADLPDMISEDDDQGSDGPPSMIEDEDDEEEEGEEDDGPPGLRERPGRHAQPRPALCTAARPCPAWPAGARRRAATSAPARSGPRAPPLPCATRQPAAQELLPGPAGPRRARPAPWSSRPGAAAARGPPAHRRGPRLRRLCSGRGGGGVGGHAGPDCGQRRQRRREHVRGRGLPRLSGWGCPAGAARLRPLQLPRPRLRAPSRQQPRPSSPTLHTTTAARPRRDSGSGGEDDDLPSLTGSGVSGEDSDAGAMPELESEFEDSDDEGGWRGRRGRAGM